MKTLTKIVIDPGHGGSDPGAVGNGLKEKDIALAISLKVAELLKLNSENVILTRTTDVHVPLVNRVPPCDVSVSIHVNAGGGIGLETWVALKNNPSQSKQLGQVIQNSVLKQIPFTNRGLKTKLLLSGKQDYLHMLREARGIPVLVEIGFIDNVSDANTLKNKANLDKIAKGIAKGILNYLGKELVEVEETKVIVNGAECKAYIINGQTFVEVRKPFEAAGFIVNYNEKTKLVEVVK